MRPDSPSSIHVDLIALIVAQGEHEPRVMTIGGGRSLPSGPFAGAHRSLQVGLRAWVERQTRHPLGYLEQLYTFADRDRSGDPEGRRIISISYLGLTRETGATPDEDEGADWRDWYAYFPWEDHRRGTPPVIAQSVAPRLARWAEEADDPDMRAARAGRAAITFGLDGQRWNDELVLQRYELLFEAGLVAESTRETADAEPTLPGNDMDSDHRRILATGIARLRAKIKYRPVVFELMEPTFTLLQLQRCVEALSGLPVHKQNFRRLVDGQDLVEETGQTTRAASGRPARLYRFRQAVLTERDILGAKLPLIRA